MKNKYRLGDEVVFVGISYPINSFAEEDYKPYYNKLGEVIELPNQSKFYEVEFYAPLDSLLLYEEEIEFPASQYLLSTI